MFFLREISKGGVPQKKASSPSPEITEGKNRRNRPVYSSTRYLYRPDATDERVTGYQYMYENTCTVTWRQDSGMRIKRASASAMGPAAGFLPPYLANPSRIKDERLDRHNEEVWQIFVEITIPDGFSSKKEYRCEIAEFVVNR